MKPKEGNIMAQNPNQPGQGGQQKPGQGDPNQPNPGQGNPRPGGGDPNQPRRAARTGQARTGRTGGGDRD